KIHPLKEQPTVTWINIDGIHDIKMVEQMGEMFGIHPLILEDILNTDQRPKIEDNGDYIFIVLKMLFDRGIASDEIFTEQISIILGPHFVISFQEQERDILKPLRERIKIEKGRIRKAGADYLAYSIIDSVVDNYFGVLEKLGEKIEILEAPLVSDPTQETLHTIQDLKQQMIVLRRSVWPLREDISYLERSESCLLQDTTGIYFKDLYDHTIQVIETVDTYRDMLSGMLDIYLSSVSNNMNKVMKVLTIIATIFMPLTFLAGIYGMNFKYMPEYQWKWAYPSFWVVNVIIVVTMIIFFKKRKWM
ncbi:MAG: magnesium/cobalt transporter CorA, partial [Syntrophales bacterium LBB04]|nr:magnesium/cobalt transporter CorA [Syntrophales bacterium LBB04]